jgi:HK97 family phage portal protein
VSRFGTFVADAAPSPVGEERAAWEEGWLRGLPIGGSAGVHVTERSALQFPAILASVIVLATDVAVLPLNVYRKRPDGGRDAVDDHPINELLSVSPDGETTPFTFRQSLVGHALLWGTGYAEIVRRGRGTPSAIHLLDPDLTRPRRVSGRLQYDLENGRSLPHEDCFRLAGFGLDGLLGLNLVRLIRESIGLGLASQGFAADFFSNGSEPDGVLQTDKTLSGPARERLQQSWEGRHQGYGKRRRVALLEEGLKWQGTSTDPEKGQLLETRRFQVNDTPRPWRLPPHKIGDYSNAHLANIEASNLDYLQTALMPWLVAWEQEAYLKLLTPAERRAGLYIEHNVNALMRGDIKSRFEAYALALDLGITNIDEVRAKENYNPLGEERGGRKHLVQLNRTTLDRIGEETELGHEPTTPADDQVEDESDPNDSGDPADGQA